MQKALWNEKSFQSTMEKWKIVHCTLTHQRDVISFQGLIWQFYCFRVYYTTHKVLFLSKNPKNHQIEQFLEKKFVKSTEFHRSFERISKNSWNRLNFINIEQEFQKFRQIDETLLSFTLGIDFTEFLRNFCIFVNHYVSTVFDI